MSRVVDALVIKQDNIAPGHYRMHLYAPEIAAAATPGQFLHLRCGSTLDPLLRRPLSIHAAERDKGTVTLFYRVAGKGTGQLAQLNAGAKVNLTGPLGRSFTIPSGGGMAALVAGGIGIAPLFYLLQELTRAEITAQIFLGAATADQLFFLEEVTQNGHLPVIATDDGSTGRRGVVTALFEDYLATLPPSDLARLTVYGCGPPAMLRHLTGIINKAGVQGEISLEERMGCGVGACLSCVCKTKAGAADWQYKRTCIEGPVFPAAEVIWE